MEKRTKYNQQTMVAVHPGGTRTDLGRLAREGTVEAIRLLQRVVTDSRYDMGLRVDAAGRLLTLGWGKAVDRSVVEVGPITEGGPTPDDMLADIQSLLARQHHNVIDITPRLHAPEPVREARTDGPSVCVPGESLPD